MIVQGGGRDKFGIYRHFCLRHPEADIIIEEDGELPKCDLCGMRTKDIPKHVKSTICQKARKRRGFEMKQDLQAEADGVKFWVNGKELDRVREFRYLGRILCDNDSDTKCIKDNLNRARARWNSVAKILKREGASAVCMGKFYLAIVQSVLLYGADSWVVTKRDWRILRSFHRRAVRYMTNSHIRKLEGDRWRYPNHGELEFQCGLFDIDTYIKRRRGTLREYLEKNRVDLLRGAEVEAKHSGDAHKVLWWEQEWIEKDEMKEYQKFWFK